jgi:hypothetical protein
LMMRTIYLPTLDWADKEFFLTFLYIASLGQAWQNPSNINPRVGLRALISPTRSDINPRVGFELLSETQPYGQARFSHLKIVLIVTAVYDWISLCRSLVIKVSSKNSKDFQLISSEMLFVEMLRFFNQKCSVYLVRDALIYVWLIQWSSTQWYWCQ